MNDYAYVVARSGKLSRVFVGDVVRFRYPVAGHETGVLRSVNGEYCMIELSLVEAGRPVMIERYRNEIII